MRAMTTTTTMTIRVPVETKTMLDKLSRDTRRSRSFLAAEAVTRYVETEAEIVAGIVRGLEDVKAGRTIPHDEAMKRLRATVAVARSRRDKRA
jgi:predicted transcriptional regulator